MSTANVPSRGYSADVRMELSVNGQVMSIGQLGPDFILLRNPSNHPPSEAEVAVWIDGRERRWNIYLPDGISAAGRETRIALG